MRNSPLRYIGINRILCMVHEGKVEFCTTVFYRVYSFTITLIADSVCCADWLSYCLSRLTTTWVSAKETLGLAKTASRQVTGYWTVVAIPTSIFGHNYGRETGTENERHITELGTTVSTQREVHRWWDQVCFWLTSNTLRSVEPRCYSFTVQQSRLNSLIIAPSWKNAPSDCGHQRLHCRIIHAPCTYLLSARVQQQ